MRLLERDAEIAAVDAALAAAVGETGAMLIVEGPAGIGKTALLDEARRRATARGMRVQLARGGALERDVAHSVARQLLEPAIRAATPEERDSLLAGAAGLAGPVVLPENHAPSLPEEAASDQRNAVLHGLYWLTANLAADGALLLAVDDAQWADAASLRFLLYLARRLEGLPVAILVTVRTGEAASEDAALAELNHAGSGRLLRPAPLSVAAVSDLTRARLSTEPEPAFASACREATGGVPFLLKELLSELVDAGIQPTAAGIAAVTQVTSSTVGHATLLRLSRLSPMASRVAKSVAVLGRHASVHRVARVGELDEPTVLLARDALIAADILSTGHPLAFAHPMVRACVYDEIPHGERSLAHAAAAALLAAEGADVEEVAVHLMATDPGASREAVSALRGAAGAALVRGAPEAATAYLRRALVEVHAAAERARVLHELARAESVVRDPLAVAHLEEALRLTADPVARAQIACDLAETLISAGRPDAALDTVETALAELGDGDPEVAAQLEVLRASVTGNDPRLIDDFEADLPRLVDLAARDEGRPGRQIAATLAMTFACHLEPAESVASLAERALDDGGLMTGDDAGYWGPQAVGALAYIGDLDRAQTAADAMWNAARQRGSAYGFVRARSLRALVFGLRGDLQAVEAELLSAFDLARQNELTFSMPSLLRWSIDAILERPQLEDVVAYVAAMDVDRELAVSFPGAQLLFVRGRVRLTRGDPEGAVDDLRRCAAVVKVLHIVNPVVLDWRSALALALPESDQVEARRLAAEELELARSTGLPRAHGVALRTAGLLERGDARVALLRETVGVLEGAGAPLESGRALVELGAALRRGNQRAAALGPLRAGLDAAHRCGADRLAVRAEEELRAAGARPRRRAVAGVDALTPTEARIARQAANGSSNREIAQALFITAKSVENQLTRVYQKLDVSGREGLAALLRGLPGS